jgi:hypothetical protein
VLFFLGNPSCWWTDSMMSALVKAILGILRGWDGWNLLNLLRIRDLEGIVKEFRGFCQLEKVESYIDRCFGLFLAA